MFDWRRRSEWLQLARYYAAGIVNLAFGYGVFAALVALGMQIYAAQALGFVIGVVFNFFTYSRIAFVGMTAGKLSFVGSYVANYLVSVPLLWLFLQIFPSPYVAGLLATIAVSLMNYFILKRLVFNAHA